MTTLDSGAAHLHRYRRPARRVGRRRAVGDDEPAGQPELADRSDVHGPSPRRLEQAATDPRVKVVRLGGAGRGFSSGAGISDEDQAQKSVDGPASVLDAANDAVRSIVNLPQPVVAVVQGPCAGVGASLALASDVVLASEKAFFMLAFTKIGLMPDGGASALIAAAVGRIRAMRMALMAERIQRRRGIRVGSGHRGVSRRGIRRRSGQGDLRTAHVGSRPCRCARPNTPSTPRR